MIYTYIVTLPPGINECVVPCLDGHTVYLSDRLDHAGRIRAYNHAVEHIQRGDLDYDNPKNVQQIESEAHHIVQPAPTLPPARSHRKRKRRSRWAADQSRIRFLQSIGFDFMAAAEDEYLEPPE